MRIGSEKPAVRGIERWRSAMLRHLSRAPELVRVLMKRRNGEAWTPEDRAFLGRELRTAARWTPGLFLFLLPGGALFLPVYAWLLDRRRKPRRPSANPAGAG